LTEFRLIHDTGSGALAFVHLPVLASRVSGDDASWAELADLVRDELPGRGRAGGW
jgi:hypothetical protein